MLSFSNHPRAFVANYFVLIVSVKTEALSSNISLIICVSNYHNMFFFFDGLTQNKIYQTSCVFRIKTCRGTTDEYVFSYGGNASHLCRKGPRHRALRLGASAPHWVPGSTQEHSFRQAMIYNSGFQ